MFGTFLCVCIIFRTLIRTKNRDPPEVSGADARYSFVIAISGVDFSAFWPLRSNHSGLEGENWMENILCEMMSIAIVVGSISLGRKALPLQL